MSWLPEIRYIFPFSLFSTFTHSAEPPRQKSPRWNRTAQTEITQVEHDILRTDHSIPVGNNRFIHVRYILERPVAEPDDIGMIEVGVGCKEHPASVKFIIHNLFVHAHRCAVNNTLQFSPWTELTEKSTSCERHQQASYQTFVGKCLQKYRMLQCPKYGHTTISQGILCLDTIQCSSCSFFFAAL